MIAELPDPGGSVAGYADAVALALKRRNLLDDKFLSVLERELPHEQEAINEIRRALSLPMHVEEIAYFDSLMDNWIYQDVAQLYADGPRNDVVAFVSVGEEDLAWRRESGPGVALESLLTVLSGIVLRDRFFVEERHIDSWSTEDSPVLGLQAGGMLCPFPEPPELWKIRSPLYRDLFHTPALKRLHQKNSLAMRESGAPANEYETAVTWGAIGYLARSAVLGVTYSGHPARRDFLAQTPFVDARRDAAVLTIDAIEGARKRYLAEIEDTAVVTLDLCFHHFSLISSRNPERPRTWCWLRSSSASATATFGAGWPIFRRRSTAMTMSESWSATPPSWPSRLSLKVRELMVPFDMTLRPGPFIRSRGSIDRRLSFLKDWPAPALVRTQSIGYSIYSGSRGRCSRPQYSRISG